MGKWADFRQNGVKKFEGERGEMRQELMLQKTQKLFKLSISLL
jgi:hypothetical protein